MSPTPCLTLPDVRQELDHSCGAAVARSLAEHFGLGGGRAEADYRRELGTTEQGTSPPALVGWLADLGLWVEAGAGMPLGDLAVLTARCVPVVCFVQWPEADPASRLRGEAGHCVAVTALVDGKVWYQDPLSGLRRLRVADFAEHWFDRDAQGRSWWRYGIAVARRRARAA